MTEILRTNEKEILMKVAGGTTKNPTVIARFNRAWIWREGISYTVHLTNTINDDRKMECGFPTKLEAIQYVKNYGVPDENIICMNC